MKIYSDYSTSQFTTHCFQRGEAQYQFFESKAFWPLDVVKQWGGWKESENQNVLIQYILNELDSRY
jgi:hypothetical protein